MNNLIEMDFVNRTYYEKSKQKIATNKNQAADLLHEVAAAMGIDLSLMKEGQVSNQRYIIQESDLDHICKILDQAKKIDGKRLRCRDYRGVGVECIDFFIEGFCHLFMGKTQINASQQSGGKSQSCLLIGTNSYC